MIIFYVLMGLILILLICATFLFIFNYHLPELKFCNDEYDVSEVAFSPRNLLEDYSINVKN